MTDRQGACPPKLDRPPIQGERRVFVRHECSVETYSQPGEGRLDQVWWPATVRNLSTAGIGLVLSRRFATGTLLAVELVSKPEGNGRKLLAHVRHATEQEDGWLLGCVFTEELSDTDLAALLP
jgi:hypothetical protein